MNGLNRVIYEKGPDIKSNKNIICQSNISQNSALLQRNVLASEYVYAEDMSG